MDEIYDKELKNFINWTDKDDPELMAELREMDYEDLRGYFEDRFRAAAKVGREYECIHGIMFDCEFSDDYDVQNPAEYMRLYNEHCKICIEVYKADTLHAINEKLRIMNKKFTKQDKIMKKLDKFLEGAV